MPAKAPIQIVDENDQPLRAGTLTEAWTGGLRHRAVFIMIEDPNGRILLQKRSPHMGLWPNHWTVSASGHVDAGEDYDPAARREAREELGLDNIQLQSIGTFRYEGTFKDKILHRFCTVYKATIPANTALTLQPEEVTETRWFPLATIRAMTTEADHITPLLDKIIEDYY